MPAHDRKNTAARKHHLGFRIAARSALVLCALLAMEGGIRLAARWGWVHIRTFGTARVASDLRYIGDINPHFGVWHFPDVEVPVRTPRGEVVYRTNSHGMRDRPRSMERDGRPRVAVLGDSFVEGVLVDAAERTTDLLEARTGVEFMNFGVTGSFGSIQQWLLYENLASRFDPTHVLLFFLPDNDFDDNDPREHSPNRYRPYLAARNDSYEVVYPTPFQPATLGTVSASRGRRIRHALYNRIYLLNVLVHRDFFGIGERLKGHVEPASYQDFTRVDIDRLLYSYRKLVEAAHPRPVMIVVIPRDSDFAALKADTFDGAVVRELERFASTHETVTIVDLLPAFREELERTGRAYRDLTLGFDPHWSPYGHRVAADAVLAAIREIPEWSVIPHAGDTPDEPPGSSLD